MKKELLIACLFLISLPLFSQGDSLVKSIISHSRKVEDQGNYDYAEQLLKSNVKTYKKSPALRSELAGFYFRKGDHRKSIRQCRRYLRRFEPSADVYQLKAHNYINLEKPSKAEKVLDEGIDKLPLEGVLYTEQGRLAMHREQYEAAINWFEEGIKNAPNSPGNYYWAAKIYCQSTEELWGLYYGEIFMNLERFTKRTREISGLLFETLNREIVFYNDTAISVNICKDANFEVPVEDTMDYVSYGQDIIEPLYKSSLKGLTHLSIRNIDRFRKKSLANYETIDKNGYADHFLIDFHRELRENGHFEAYNYWLFMMGNPAEFQSWEHDNSSQWSLFIDWFEGYAFQIQDTDFYYSSQFR